MEEKGAGGALRGCGDSLGGAKQDAGKNLGKRPLRRALGDKFGEIILVGACDWRVRSK